MAESKSRPYRAYLPVWVWVWLALYAGFVVWLRWIAESGDRGLVNMATMICSALALLVLVVWFAFFSRFRRRTRFRWLAGAAVSLTIALTVFEWQGFSGSLVPQFDLRFGSKAAAPQPVSLAAEGIDLVTTTPEDFPGFLGPHRDLRVPGVTLARDWEAEPPEEIWRQPIGEGWSAFAVVNGYAVTMEQRGDEQAVTAYDLLTGELRWSHSWPGTYFHALGGSGPRSTPLIDEGRVYALGPRGRLVCLDGATGEPIWEKDLLEEFGVSPEKEFELIQFGRSNSPLVLGDLLIIPGGGLPDRPPASLVAYDKVTGEKVWEGGSTQISHSSPRLATLGGREQILILDEDRATGHDPATGAVLWEHPWPGKTSANATSSQAVPVPPDRVFVSKGYGGGSALFELLPRGDGTFDTREIWHERRSLRTKFTNVVIHQGHVYGLSEGILECVRLDTGERVWKEGRYGQGQILMVGDTLLIQTEDGEIVHLDPSPERPNDVLGRFQAIEGTSWNNLALYGPYLAVRNSREAAVWRLPLAG